MDTRSDNILRKYNDDAVRRINQIEVESEDEDDLFEQLENDDEFANYRERRVLELSAQMKDITHKAANGFGHVETFLSEESVLQTTTNTRLVVVHFFHKGFSKCEVMDKKLDILAEKHLQTKFIRISVEDAPFLVTRLNIKVLPVVILYINGVEANRLVGFEKLNFNNNSNDFDIKSLENFLYSNGLVQRKANNYQKISKTLNNNQAEDDESDLDI